MSRIKLDLKDFKHVKSDDQSTTLQNKQGHQVILAHKSLHPDNRAQLSALSKMAKEDMTASQKGEAESKYAKGGKVDKRQMYAEGSREVRQVNPGDEEAKYNFYQNAEDSGELSAAPLEPTEGSDAIQTPEARAHAAKEQDAAVGRGYVPKDQQPTPVPTPTPDPTISQTPPAMQPVDGQQATNEVPTPNSNQPVSPSQPEDMGLSNKLTESENALNQQALGAESEALYGGELGKQQAAAQQKFQKDQKEVMDTFKTSYQKLNEEGAALRQDILDGHVDPNRFINNMHTGDKILTGIGLLLSGFGSGASHQPNMAFDFLNKQIDNDIKAQQIELGKKENLLHYNTQQLGNLREGLQATKLYNVEMLNSKLQQTADAIKDPIAKARVLQIQGQFGQQAAQLHFQLAQNMAINHIMNQPSDNPSDTAKAEHLLGMLRQTDPEKAKQLEPLIVPGVGVAKVAVPQATRDQMVARQTLSTMTKRFYDWSAAHSGDINPKDVAVGHTMAAELQSMYRNSINGGVFKKGEQEFIDNIVDSDPTKFFNKIRVLPKLKEVYESNEMQNNILKHSVGIPVQHQQAEPQYKTVGGKKYMRGPNGEAIEVK